MQLIGQPVNLTSTNAISSVPGNLVGFYVNSTSSGTIVLRDGGASGAAITGTITPDDGWHPFPASFSTSAHATIANTLNVTFIFAPG